MKISPHSKSRLIGFADQISGLGLKVGIPVVIAAAGYLLYAMLGNSIRDMAGLPADQRERLADGLGLVMMALRAGAVVLVLSILLRVFNEEATGQALSLFGAVLYFGSPALFASAGSGTNLDPKSMRALAQAIETFRYMGGVALLPGLVLVLRDAILRIWTGVSVRRVLERRWGDEEERRKAHRKPRYYGSCWDMPFCREFVQKVCPAWQVKKPCWRLKIGCYCDEKTILTAMTAFGSDNVHVKGIMESLGISKTRDSLLNARQRRARCRRCGIYAEHQRQKYRLFSPLVFPFVGLAFWAFYGQLSPYVRVMLEKTDRFMQVLTLRTNVGSSTDEITALTTLAMIWLGIIVISYALRALEYLIFEAQV